MNPSTPTELHTISPIIYRYLDMLAERTVSLEQRIELNEMRKLRFENKQLREALAQSSRLEMEQLVSFLPVIYKDFWNSVSPAELALLGGNLNINNIAEVASYTIPSQEIIAYIKNKLMQMPEANQKNIVEFCRSLPFKLTVRPEMKDFFDQFK